MKAAAQTERICLEDLRGASYRNGATNDIFENLAKDLTDAVNAVAEKKVNVSIRWMNHLDKVVNPDGMIGFFEVISWS